MAFDHALSVLQAASGVNDAQRADLHDMFHGAKDEDELADALKSYSAPDDVKQKLIQAKIESHGPIERGFAVVERLGGLDAAENHPHIARALISMVGKSKDNGDVHE